MSTKDKLSRIKYIVQELLELENPLSDTRKSVLKKGVTSDESGLIDSYLVGHYMGRVRHISEILSEE